MRVSVILFLLLVSFSSLAEEGYSWRNHNIKKICLKRMEASYQKVKGNLENKIKEGKVSKKDHKERPSLFSPASVYAHCILSESKK